MFLCCLQFNLQAGLSNKARPVAQTIKQGIAAGSCSTSSCPVTWRKGCSRSTHRGVLASTPCTTTKALEVPATSSCVNRGVQSPRGGAVNPSGVLASTSSTTTRTAEVPAVPATGSCFNRGVQSPRGGAAVNPSGVLASTSSTTTRTAEVSAVPATGSCFTHGVQSPARGATVTPSGVPATTVVTTRAVEVPACQPSQPALPTPRPVLQGKFREICYYITYF